MQAATQTSTASEVVTPYARRLGARRGPVRRWMVIGGVVAGLAGAVALATSVRDLVGRVFSRAVIDPALYEIKPVDLSISLTEDGELKPRESVEVKNEVEGQSTILFVVEESKRVQKGDLLVELASDTLKERVDTEDIELRKIRSDHEAATQELEITRNENASKIKKAEIDLEVARLDLRQYTEGEYLKAIKSADIDIQQTNMDIARKQDELDKSEDLAVKGFVTKSKLEELRLELKKAELTLEKNELSKRILMEYDCPKSKTQKTSAVEQAEQELEREGKRSESREKQALARVEERAAVLAMREQRLNRLREQLQKCKIVAPIDGIVQYPGDSSDWRYGGGRIAAGEKVHEGQTLVILPDTSQMVVKTRIHEADRHKVREGLTCLVTVPAVPGRTFAGKLSKITKFADTANRWLNPDLKEHTTEILLEPTDAPLSPGDSAEVKILVENVAGALAVPVQCVFSRGKKNFVFVQRGLSFEPVGVSLGRSSTTLIEVAEGLSFGQVVTMNAGEDLLALLPSVKAGEEEPFEPPEEPKEVAERGERTARSDDARRPRSPEARSSGGRGARVASSP